MANLDQAQLRADELRSEVNALLATVAELEAQHTQSDAGLDELFARSERVGDDAARQAVAEAEANIAELASQLRRKKAALTAAQTDLSKAEEDLKTARLLAHVEGLDAIADEMSSIAEQLNKDLLNIPHWVRLVELTGEGRKHFHKLRHIESFVQSFREPLSALQQIYESQRGRIDYAIRRGDGTQPADTIDVAGALELDRVRQRIAACRRGIN